MSWTVDSNKHRAKVMDTGSGDDDPSEVFRPSIKIRAETVPDLKERLALAYLIKDQMDAIDRRAFLLTCPPPSPSLRPPNSPNAALGWSPMGIGNV